MKNTATLKAVLAALTLVGASSLAFAKSSQVKIWIRNQRSDQKTVTISAKQGDGTIVTKGTLRPPRTTSMGSIQYDTQQLPFNRTDTIIATSGNLPLCETPINNLRLGKISSNAPFTVYDKSCQ